MTSTIVPPVDLAPGMPSRVVTISATDVTEGGQPLEGQMVRFALSDTLDVSSGGDVIAKTQAEVVLDSNGEGRIRLPVYDEDVKTWCGKDWAVLVTATWGSQKAIRVPAGTSSIALSALPPVRPLRGREKQWAITGASVTVTEGGQWDATLDLSGGILNLDLTVPPGARPMLRGRIEAGGNPDNWRSGDSRQGQWDIINTSDAQALIANGYRAPQGTAPHYLEHYDDLGGAGGAAQRAITISSTGMAVYWRFALWNQAFGEWREQILEWSPKAFNFRRLATTPAVDRDPTTWTTSGQQGLWDVANQSDLTPMQNLGYLPPRAANPHIIEHLHSGGGWDVQTAVSVSADSSRMYWRPRPYNQGYEPWRPLDRLPQETLLPASFMAVGDSWVEGGSHGSLWPVEDTWVHKLGQNLGVTARNAGRGGAFVDEAALRAGRKQTYVKFSAGEIPASGSSPVTLSWTPELGGPRWFSQRGYIAGIRVFLECNGTTGAWTIRRDSASPSGAPTGAHPVGTGWMLWESDWQREEDQLTIIRTGMNNVARGVHGPHPTVVDHVVAGIDTYLSSLPLSGHNVIVMGLVPHLGQTGQLPVVSAINAGMKALAPRAYFDCLGYMQTEALADMGITPTQADLDAIDAGFAPASCYDAGDNGHANKAFHTALAGKLASIITDRGLVRP